MNSLRSAVFALLRFLEAGTAVATLILVTNRAWAEVRLRHVEQESATMRSGASQQCDKDTTSMMLESTYSCRYRRYNGQRRNQQIFQLLGLHPVFGPTNHKRLQLPWMSRRRPLMSATGTPRHAHCTLRRKCKATGAWLPNPCTVLS